MLRSKTLGRVKKSGRASLPTSNHSNLIVFTINLVMFRPQPTAVFLSATELKDFELRCLHRQRSRETKHARPWFSKHNVSYDDEVTWTRTFYPVEFRAPSSSPGGVYSAEKLDQLLADDAIARQATAEYASQQDETQGASNIATLLASEETEEILPEVDENNTWEEPCLIRRRALQSIQARAMRRRAALMTSYEVGPLGYNIAHGYEEHSELQERYPGEVRLGIWTTFSRLAVYDDSLPGTWQPRNTGSLPESRHHSRLERRAISWTAVGPGGRWVHQMQRSPSSWQVSPRRGSNPDGLTAPGFEGLYGGVENDDGGMY